MKTAVLALVLVATVADGASCDDKSNFAFRSAKTCEMIDTDGVSIVNLGMDPAICIVTETSVIRVTTRMNFEQARQRCSNIGARLCSIEEINYDPDAWSSGIYGNQVAWSAGYVATSTTNPHVATYRLSNTGMTPDGDGILPIDGRVATGVFSTASLCCADYEGTPRRHCKSCKVPHSIYNSGMSGAMQMSCKCQTGFTAEYGDTASMGKPVACKDNRNGMNSCSANMYAVGSTSVCSNLGSSFSSVSPTTCAAVNLTWTGTSCDRPSLNYLDAEGICTEAGARLPTMTELADPTISSGIRALVANCTRSFYAFTSNPCGDGKVVAAEIGGRKRTRCVPYEKNRAYTVACVAKTTKTECVAVPPQAVSASGSQTYTCITGKWSNKAGACLDTKKPTKAPTTFPTFVPTTNRPTISCRTNQYNADYSEKRPSEIETGAVRQSFGSRRVWAYQPLESNGNCPATKTFSQAKSMCEANGARLCTLSELTRKEAKLRNAPSQLMCGNNAEEVWSSSPCCTAPGTCNSQKNSVLLGAGGRRTPTCITSSGNEKRQVRCCVDSVPSRLRRNQCANCPRWSTSNGSGDITSCSCDSGYFGRNGGECLPQE